MTIVEIKAARGGTYMIEKTGETVTEFFAEAEIELDGNTLYVSVYYGSEDQYAVAGVSSYECFAGDVEPYTLDAFDEFYTSKDEAAGSEFASLFTKLDDIVGMMRG